MAKDKRKKTVAKATRGRRASAKGKQPMESKIKSTVKRGKSGKAPMASTKRKNNVLTTEEGDEDSESFSEFSEEDEMEHGTMDQEVNALGRTYGEAATDVGGEIHRDPFTVAMAQGRPSGSMPTVPRTGHVSDKDRQKIREGKFVEFSALIMSPVSSTYKKKFTLDPRSGVFEEIEEVEHLTLHKWYDSFVIFMSIRLEYAPNEAQGLLRHCQIVKGIHSQGKDGVSYDCRFRRLKGQHPTIQWGEYLTELVSEIPSRLGMEWHKAESFRRGRAGMQAPGIRHPQHMNNVQQMGNCTFFNTPKGCINSRCRYSHRCGKCGKTGHNTTRCWTKQ